MMNVNHLTKEQLKKELQKLKQEYHALKVLYEKHKEKPKQDAGALKMFEWMLQSKESAREDFTPEYGDLSSLNKDGLILNSVGKEQLRDIVSEYLDLLETSAAIYERNGDYALGIFSSGWCQMMDAASRKLCNTDDNRKALASGKWLCHDSCWKDASVQSMNEGKPAEVACNGGIYLYAVPVWANNQIIGAINFGFGSPPKDDAELKKLSKKYKIPLKALREQSRAYKDRPQFIIDYAKQRLQNAAKYLGYLVERKIAEDKHKEIEQNFRITLYSIGDAVITVDIKGNITLMNPVAERLCGYKMEQVLGKRLSQVLNIINTHTGEKVDNPVKEVMETGKVVELAKYTKLIAKDGREYQIADSAAPIENRDGEITGVVLVFSDVTDKYKAEQLLKQAKERYRIISETTTDFTFSCKKEKKGYEIDWIAGAVKKITGYPVDDIKAEKCWRFMVHPDDDPIFKKHVLSLKPGEESQCELRILDPAGTVKWLSVNTICLVDEDKETHRIFGGCEDITEHKQVEKALLRTQKTVDKSPLSVFWISPMGKFIYVNETAAKKLQYAREELLSMHVWDVDPNYPREKRKEMFNLYRETGELSFESAHRRSDGSLVPVKINSYYLAFEDQEMEIAEAEDITERKRAEEALRESEEQHRRLFETMSQGVIYQAADGTIISANPAAERYLGLTLDQMLGKTSMDPRWKMITEDGGKVPGSEYPTMVALQTGKKVGPTIRGFYIPEKDEYAWLSITATPLYQPGEDKPFQAYAVFDDITSDKKNEDEIKKQQQLINTILEKLPIGIAVNTVGPEPEVELINDNFARIYCVKKEDLTTVETFWEAAYEDEAFREEVKNRILSDMESGDPERMQWHNVPITKNGKVVKYISAKNILLEDQGLVISTVIDTTERKLAETEIINARDKAEESRLRFETLFSESPVSILIYDKDTGEVVDANKAAYTAYGFDSLKALQQSDIWMEPPYSVKDAVERIQKAARDGVQVFEWKSRKVTGEVFWELVTLRPMVIDGVERILSTSIDITEQKQKEVKEEVLYGIANATFVSKDVEALLANIKKLLNKLIDTTNFYVALYDRGKDMFTIPYEADEKDQIETWPAKKSTTGLVIRKKKALLLKKPDILKLVESGEIEQIGNMCEVWLGVPLLSGPDIIGVLAVQDYHNPNAYDKGSKEILEFVSSQIGMAIQRKKFIEDLVAAKEEAQESNRLKSAFLANMSHEIRTPMNSILGFSELLKNPRLTGDQKGRFIATIEKSGERMLNLINDIVDISKIESGQMEVHKSAVDLQNSMLFLLDFFKPEFNKSKPDVQLRLNMPPEKTTIHTDKEKLHSVLINLIKNAEKFTKKGVVEFGFGPGDGVLHFFVRDTGIGIPKDKHPRVFDRFYQVDTSLSSGYEGAGLGLPITKAFVELLGGNIWLESEPGKGTTFYFSLPAGAETSTQAREKEDLPGRTKDTPAKTRKILVVEDDQASYDLIRYMLDKHTKLFHAPTGEKAIGIFKKHPDIDLILMDIKMPGIDGLETTRKIRAFNKEIPIIAQTAHALAGDREKALEAGCDDYIAKPIKQAELLKCVERNIKN